MSYLEQLVVFKIKELGDESAAQFFGVSVPLVRQWANGSKRPSLAAVEKVFEPPQEPVLDADWAGKDVMLCLPQYKTTNPQTLFSLLGIWDRAKFGALVEYGDAFIIHARESLADKFLKSGLPFSLWMDDDMIVPMGDANWFRNQTGMHFLTDEFAGLHTGNRLRSHEKSIVGGLYFGRKPHGRAMYYDAMVDSLEGAQENRRAHTAPINGIKQTKWVGTGCLWVAREVFLDIQNTHPHLAPTFPKEPFHFFSNASDGAMLRFDEIEAQLGAAKQQAEGGSHEVALQHLNDAVRLVAEARSDNLRTAHHMQGEDQTFGIRAGKAGHPSFVDLGLVCGHIGTCVYGPHNTLAPSPRHVHN